MGDEGLSKEEVALLREIHTSIESEDGSSSEDEEYKLSEHSFSDDSDGELQPRPQPQKKRKTAAKDKSDAFKWTSGPFTPMIHPFDRTKSGFHPPKDFPENAQELDYFECFFGRDITELIALETNRYYHFVINRMPNIPPHSRLTKWRETNADEIFLFIGVTMLISRNKKLKLNECWSGDPLLQSPIFSKVMARDRYLLLLRLLHFCDNDAQKEGERLYKLDMVLSYVQQKLSSLFTPFENLCVDESLVLWKGRLSFRQYMKSKRHRFGIKLFVLCDVETDYILKLVVYTGASTRLHATDLGISGSVVITLLENYLGIGHKLFIDNWYNSPELALFLHRNQTNVCGTVRSNRRYMPQLPDPKQQGEIEARHTNEMLAMKWKDRRVVAMLTTIYDDNFIATEKKNLTTKEYLKKPACVVKYNQNMGTVDKIDMLLSSVECLRKTIKWYKKIFFHLIDLCTINAHSMYKVKTGNHTTLADFQLEIIRQIIQKYKKEDTNPQVGRPSSGDNPIRLSARHFVSKILPVPGKKKCQRLCFVCKHTEKGERRRRDTSYHCEICDKALCLVPCFELYHTKKRF